MKYLISLREGAARSMCSHLRTSVESLERVRYRLARNNSGDLTENEVAKLERFCELEHLMRLLKARAHLYGQRQS